MARVAKKITAGFYATAAGNHPVIDFILGLSDEDRKAIGQDLATVEFRWPLGMPTVRLMGEGLHEVRSNISSKRIVRTLLGVVDDELLVVHAFIKKTARTPKEDLELARKRRGGDEMKGKTLEAFLDDLGIKNEVYSVATKCVLALQMNDAMTSMKVSKSEMAGRMATSRSQLDRLLDPQNDRVQLDTIVKAANVLGKRVRIELVDADA